VGDSAGMSTWIGMAIELVSHARGQAKKQWAVTDRRPYRVPPVRVPGRWWQIRPLH
jgi:hypothetical protein